MMRDVMQENEDKHKTTKGQLTHSNNQETSTHTTGSEDSISLATANNTQITPGYNMHKNLN